MRSLDRDDAISVLKGTSARYAPTGHLVFGRGSGLRAMAFDLRSRRTSGSPVVVEEVQGLNVYQQYYFALSDQGTLAYVPDLSDSTSTRLVAVSAAGSASALPIEPRFLSDPRLSPDGTRLAIDLQDDEDDVWVADPARGSLMRLSSDPGEDEHRSGRATGASSPGRPRVRRSPGASTSAPRTRAAARSCCGPERAPARERLVGGWRDAAPRDPEPGDPRGPVRLRLGATPAPEVFVQTRFGEHSGRISPSGRHVAYVSDESGREEVYVQSFPEPGGKLQVSTSGGAQPLWSHDGRSVFFRGGGSVQAVAFTPGPPAAVSVPRPLFADRFETPRPADTPAGTCSPTAAS